MCISIRLQNEDSLVLANNYDSPQEVGYLVTNQRGMNKEAFIRPSDQPLRWTSRYGSVTFNQLGKEFPHEGMNEAGLVTTQVILPQTRYPAAEGRPAIREIQLAQYLLDTCTGIDEVRQALDGLMLVQSTAPFHYMFMDAAGNAAILEYIDGAERWYAGESLPIPVLANNTYDDSIVYLGGDHSRYKEDSPYGRNSLLRVEKAAERLKSLPKAGNLQDYALSTLDLCAREDNQWQIVYEPRAGEICFRTTENRNLKYVLFSELSLSARSNPEYMWMDKPARDNVSQRLNSYTPALNRELVQFFFSNPAMPEHFGLHLNSAQRELLAAYPETLRA